MIDELRCSNAKDHHRRRRNSFGGVPVHHRHSNESARVTCVNTQLCALIWPFGGAPRANLRHPSGVCAGGQPFKPRRAHRNG